MFFSPTAERKKYQNQLVSSIRRPGLPDGIVFIPKMPIMVQFGRTWDENVWLFYDNLKFI
jgi:hypothetical protein